MKSTKSFPSRGSNISKRVITSTTTSTSSPTPKQTSISAQQTTATSTTVKNQPSQRVISSAKNYTCKDQVCDICAQNIPGPEREKIFAFGKCDHFVCYVCSARLRVICDQLDCPICREKLDIVIFSSSKDHTFAKFTLKKCIYDEKYKIHFENDEIRIAFKKLFKFECLECSKTSGFTLSKKKSSHTSIPVEKSNQTSNQDTPAKASDRRQRTQKKSSGQQPSTGVGSGPGSGGDPQANGDSTIAESSATSSMQATNDVKPPGTPSSFDDDDTIEDASHGILKTDDLKRDYIFPDVFKLRNHLQYVHKLKLCDLCLTHNKLFPYEYSYYDVMSLKVHMKEGEPRTSHRGHPNCKLCNNTFFNQDELLQHMSREHFHCHLCARHDSHQRIYFLDYSSLRDHFKSKHFLCERENCRHEQFTSAFENMVEYQLHLVHVHETGGSNLSRGGLRQLRTITLDSASHRNRDTSPSRETRQNLPRNMAVVSTGNIATSNSQQQRTIPDSIPLNLLRQQRLPSRNEFPVLGQQQASLSSTPPMTTNQSVQISFPALPQTSNSPRKQPTTTSYRPQPSSSNQPATSVSLSNRLNSGFVSRATTQTNATSRPTSFVSTLGGGLRSAELLTETDFPPLPDQPKPSGSKRPGKKVKNWAKNNNDRESMTLDQLLGNGLLIGGSNRKNDSKKPNSKNVKQKPFKIQL